MAFFLDGEIAFDPERTRTLLELVVEGPVPLELVERWPVTDRLQVVRWAWASYRAASDNEGVAVPPRPECLAGIR